MSEKYVVVDLFSGLGGWAKGFLKYNFEVHGYDIQDFSEYYPGIFHQCDLREYKKCDFPDRVDVIVSSSPCTEFTKMSMPWKWRFKKIDLEEGIRLFNLQFEIRDYLNPRFWVFENVRGAAMYVKIPYSFRIGSRYFWTNVEPFKIPLDKDVWGDKTPKYKKNGIDRPTLRSEIPIRISENFAFRIKNALDNKI